MKLLLGLLIGLLLLSSLAKAESIYKYGVDAEIFSNNTVNYNLEIVFVNNTAQTVVFPIGLPISVKIESPGCTVQKGTLETFVTCSLEASDRTVIKINYVSKSVNQKDNYLLFSESFRLTNDTKALTVLIKLPEGAGLKEPTDNSFSPSGALIGSDGRRTIINWVSNDLRAGDRFDASIAFERIVEISSNFPFTMVLISIIIIFSGLGVFYQFYWKAKNVEIILPVLKKDEKIIFNTIIKHGNGVNQKVIVKDSGYSKAKVSKVLSSLKERGLIKLERIGRSNKVHIEKNFEKKS